MDQEKITFSVQMTAKEIYRFTMYHMYHGFSGIFGVCLSLTAFIILITSFGSLADQSKTILILLAAWFIVIDPIILWVRSKGQAKRNKAYEKPLNYQLDSSGITVSQGEERQTIVWENLTKIVETKSQYLVYSSKVHAFIFPKKAIRESSGNLDRMILHYIEGTNIHLKGPIKKKNIKSQKEV